MVRVIDDTTLRELVEATRTLLRQAPHDPAKCRDPSGWRPRLCTCAVRRVEKALAAADDTLGR